MATYKTGWMKKLINGVSMKIFAISHVKAIYYDYANLKTLETKLDEMDTATDSKLANGFVNLNQYLAMTYGIKNVAIGEGATAGCAIEDSWGIPDADKYKFQQNNIALGVGAKTEVSYIYEQTSAGQQGIPYKGVSNAVAIGTNARATKNMVSVGHYNRVSQSAYRDCGSSGTNNAYQFTVGCGTSSSAGNAFRVTAAGDVYSTKGSITTGADYAEYFEWSDGNEDEQDRVGYFVTFDETNEGKIRIAGPGEYILGIVSGTPAIIGNGDENWRGRYIMDDLNRFIEIDATDVELYKDEETEEIKERTIKIKKYKENPEYNPEETYIPRQDRKEWDAVGMVGVLRVHDDGSCAANGYCTVGDNGIAVSCERGIDTYRVIRRVTDNIVEVLMR